MISVIITTYNRFESLKNCIDSIYNQTIDDEKVEIIVIDDGSTDDTPSITKKYKKVRYFRNNRKGHGAGCNLGIKKAKGEIIAFIDDDCIADKDWLKNILLTFNKHKEVSGIGGAIINPYDSKIAWANYILNFSCFFHFGKIRKVNYIASCNSTYRRRDVKNFSYAEKLEYMGYDETYFLYQLKKAGKKILFNPGIKVIHFEKRGSIKELLKKQQVQGMGFKNYYYVHGFIGELLFKFKFLNFLCPRLILVFFRCVKSKEYLWKFIECFPLILRGEFERARTINSKI